MRITNFRYANHTLKYYGFMVCSFDKNGIQTNSNGSEIEFKTTPLFNGKQQYLTSSNYKNCITAEIDICPIPDCENNTDTTFVTVEQERNSETESVVIKNCSPGETIWLHYPISASDLSTHKISRDFNYHFLKISKTESMKENYYSCNIQDTLLSCSYSPVIVLFISKHITQKKVKIRLMIGFKMV